MPRCDDRARTLAAALGDRRRRGLFSGLFGVGGGTVIVPLLVLWLGYEEREATGTSLAAIVLIAARRRGSRTAPTATCTSATGC